MLSQKLNRLAMQWKRLHRLGLQNVILIDNSRRYLFRPAKDRNDIGLPLRACRRCGANRVSGAWTAFIA